MDAELDLREIRYRLQTHGSFRLLRKEKAALMLAFFLEAFKRGHRADVPRGVLAAELSAFRDYTALTDGEADPAAGALDARTSASYLDEWADEGFLRKYYRPELDEPSYDLTPESEKAIEWLRELSERRFVGAESRLLKVFDLMKDIAYGAAFNADERLEELEKQKLAVEAEIARVKAGGGAALDPTAVRERYYELEDTARRLLADFRQIERNFRDLDRDARARAIAAEGSRGSVLKGIFELRDAILASDQGKSFQAFWAYVMSSDKQREFAALAGRVLELDTIAELPKSFDLSAFDRLLAAAGARVQATAHRLNEELRAFLDEKRRQEGRAVAALAQEIKRLALAVRDAPPPDKDFLVVEGDADLDLIMERPLFQPEAPARIGQRPEAVGASDADAADLFEASEFDLAGARERVRACLAAADQAALADIVAAYPVSGGAAELLGYLLAAGMDGSALVDDADRIGLRADNRRRGTSYAVDAPSVVFMKESPR